MATIANLVIDQGATFSTTITITDEEGNLYDLTGHSGAAQMRKHYTSVSATGFSVSLGAGTVTLSMNAATSNILTPGRYVYDVEITSNANVVSRIVEGIVTVTPNVTR